MLAAACAPTAASPCGDASSVPLCDAAANATDASSDDQSRRCNLEGVALSGAAIRSDCGGADLVAELATGEGESAHLADLTAGVQRNLVSEASLGFAAFLLSTRHASLHREGCAALLASTRPFEARPRLEPRPFEVPASAGLSEVNSHVEQQCAAPGKEAAAENGTAKTLFLPHGASSAAPPTPTWPGHSLEVAVGGEAVSLSTLLRRLVAAGSLLADECAPMLLAVHDEPEPEVARIQTEPSIENELAIQAETSTERCVDRQ